MHEGVTGGRIALRELGTGELRECVCPAGYDGQRGEVWLARILPSPVATSGDSIVVTTPCVIQNPGTAGWQAYLDRTLSKIANDPTTAYTRLMKHGLGERFWLEYVFEAYASHRAEAVFLMGLPDIAESRPHSSASQARSDELHFG